MSAAEKILIAEETVAGLQGQLGIIETVLETAEQVVDTGEKAGRCLRRFFLVLLVLSVIAVVVTVVKKVTGGRCSAGEESAPDPETNPDTDNDGGDASAMGDEASPDGDADAS